MKKYQYEIERKWLIDIKKIPFNINKFKYKKIEQCYISKNPTVRIRKIDNNYILTIKKNIDKDKIKRYELEVNLTKFEYLSLKNISISNIILKNRYKIPFGKYNILIDVFYKNLKGIVLAEIEFKNLLEAKKFKAPDWFGLDVTKYNKYTNLNLSFKK